MLRKILDEKLYIWLSSPDFFSDQINTNRMGRTYGTIGERRKMSRVLRCETPRKGTTWKNRGAAENNIKMELK